MGTFARALEDFFTHRGLALPTDQAERLAAERLAAGRRKRRIDAVPNPLRPAVAAFDAYRMRAQDRARRAGTRPRSNHTLETALSILRDLARFLTEHRGKDDWALVDVDDIEVFLATSPKARKRRLVVLRQFFRFARSQRIVLIDPTRTPIVKERNGFRGRTLTLGQQRALPSMDDRRSRSPPRGSARHARSAAWSVQHRGPDLADHRRRRGGPDRPARQATPSRPAGSRLLDRAGTLPGPPREVADDQPACDSHQRNQGRAEPGLNCPCFPRS
ncbi:site-specific integrase [Streptomyces malaysiensis]|uniref:site-specific integrase n=1 Tax=Streptomyces malaysiensis TaxID=92644 RepID=UPI00190D2B0E|nr:site-specific integrase [Streptomyces sp. SPMA113]